ncbi:MAG: flagellar basal-body MS-ring/collar protein FliF [Planctomycetota bacterium]|jgi:flagellar M-ring protein FliF
MLDNLNNVWQRATLMQRVALLGILLGLGVAAALLVVWARKPSMGLLFANLPPEEAGKVVERIRDEKIPFELTNGGSTIYVPYEKVHEMRLAMATEGLPSASSTGGYEVLEGQPIGTSPMVQRMNVIRAIEGELSRTIETIPGVNRCRVHVVRPEAQLFVASKQSASASVAVTMRQGTNLRGSSIAAIVHLVSGAVEGLSPENVVLVADGKLLAGNPDDSMPGGMGGTGGILNYKQQVEKDLTDKAMGLLAAALGSGRAIVKVDVEVDTTATTTVTQKYDEKKKATVRETMSKSSEATTSKDNKNGTTKTEDTETEYAPSMTYEEVVNAPGKVLSKQVAVVVDLTPPTEDSEEGGAAPTKMMTVQDVEKIVRQACGLTESDKLSVVEQRLHLSVGEMGAEPVSEGGLFSGRTLLDLARRGSLGILVVGALVALKVMGKGGAKKGKAALQLAATGVDGEAVEQAQPKLDPDLLRTQITHALEDNPEEVKQLFLSWIESQN